MIYFQVALVVSGGFLLPWWWLFIVGILSGWYFQPRYQLPRVLFSSFLTGLMTWGIFAYYFDLRSGGLVSERLSRIFSFNLPIATYFITGLVASLSLLFSSWLGWETRAYREKNTLRNTLKNL